MVIAHHLIWTNYGWWLPNDPRGSSSHEIRVEAIAELGELHHGRKVVQPSRQELREFYQQAEPILAHSVRLFTEDDRALIADSIARTIQREIYTCFACAIMPDHVHLLIRRHRHKAEQMLEVFQADSRAALIAAGQFPAGHPIWGGPGWKVFQNTPAQVRSTIRYIEHNPLERGLSPQRWDFVIPYDSWLPGRATW